MTPVPILPPNLDRVGTVDQLLRLRAEHQPDRVAFTHLLDGETRTATLTYAQIDRRARAVAMTLQQYVRAGDRALVAYDSGLDFICAFFGCLYADVIAVPVAAPRRRHDARIRAIADACRAAVSLAPGGSWRSERHIARASGEPLRRVDVSSCDLSLADEWRPSNACPDRIAFLQFTSGSTAEPRGVVLTHANLLHNQSAIRSAFRTTSESSVFGWLPLHHDMGLIGTVLHPIFMGIPCVLMSPAHFVERPVRWLRALTQFRSTISGGPDFAFDLCVRRTSLEERQRLDLSHWAVAFDGAEPVRPDTLRSFARAFSVAGFRAEAFHPCYGLAEATLFVAGRPEGPATACFDRSLLSRGTARPVDCGGQQSRELVAYDPRSADHEIHVVSEDGSTMCPSGDVGEIWIAGSSVAEGYWGRPEETESCFRAHLPGIPDRRFLRTGDLGFISAGRLFLAGRAKDLIILRGRNLYPEDIERSVETSHPLLRRGGGVAFSVDEDGREQLVVVHEVERKYQDDSRHEIASAIRQVVAAEHEAQVQSIVLAKIGEIPRTTSGKVQRRLCKSRFLNGTLGVLSRWDFPLTDDDDAPPLLDNVLSLPVDQRRESVLTLVRETAAHLLGIPSAAVDVNTPLAGLGFDSLMVVELQHRIERALRVRISAGPLAEEANITAMVDRVCELTMPPATSSHQEIPVGEFALSQGQRALWVTEQLAGGNTPGPLSRALSVRGPLDPRAFLDALHRLVERHPALRTTIGSSNGEPRQTVRVDEAADVLLIDGTSWTEQRLRSEVQQELARPMPFEGGSLFRGRLIRHSTDEYVLVIAVHHGVADYWSVGVMLEDLEELYAARRESRPDPLAPLVATYAHFVVGSEQWLQSDEARAAEDFWRRELSGAPLVLDIAGDRVRPAVQTYRGGTCWCAIDAELAAGLKRLARSHDVTLFVVCLAAYFVLLHRHTAQNDILVGVPVANRRDAGWRDVVGYFVNLLVVRGELKGDLSFAALLQQTAARVARALAHQDLPFSTVVEHLRPPRELSRHPVVQCSLVLLSDRRATRSDVAALAVGAPDAHVRFNDLSLATFALEAPYTEFDLSLTIAETTDGLTAKFDYSRDLFDGASVRRLADRWKTLLNGIAAGPIDRLGELPLMPASEREQMVAASNGPSEPSPRTSAHRLVEQQVVNAPEAIVADEMSSMTFDELNRRANQLARYLRRLGVHAETRVGLCVGRSTAMVVGALGVMKSGGAYVALDPSHPRERLASILADSGASMIVTDRDASAFASPAVRVIHLVHDRDRIATEAIDNLSHETHPDQAVYVMYTSGSTGVPNGVVVPHRALTNLLRSMQRAPGLTAADRLLSVTTLAFDIAGLELFLPLITGASLMIAGQDTVVDAVRLAGQIERWHPTVMQATPATWRLLLESGWAGRPDLNVLCGGEALTVDLASRLRRGCAAVWNMYGPTETTIWSTTGELGEGPTISLGAPIDNTETHVLDSNGQPVPFGVGGELFIGGEGLARGYLGRADLTAERFVPNPFSSEPGRRLYRTGDRVRRHADGTLEFLGRTDLQCKLRGFRIDPAEIERVIAAQSLVEQCVVTTREDRRGDKVLVAYVVGDRSSEQSLRERIAAALPSYMVPAIIVFLPALPLTPNGKVDRKVLAMLSLNEPQTAGSSGPGDDVERAIAEIWRDVLQVERVGVTDNFFDLGGHSLVLNLVRVRLEKTIGREVPLIELFRHPTIRTLAQFVAGDRRDFELAVDRDKQSIIQRRAGAERMRQLKQSRDDARRVDAFSGSRTSSH